MQEQILALLVSICDWQPAAEFGYHTKTNRDHKPE